MRGVTSASLGPLSVVEASWQIRFEVVVGADSIWPGSHGGPTSLHGNVPVPENDPPTVTSTTVAVPFTVRILVYVSDPSSQYTGDSDTTTGTDSVYGIAVLPGRPPAVMSTKNACFGAVS